MHESRLVGMDPILGLVVEGYLRDVAVGKDGQLSFGNSGGRSDIREVALGRVLRLRFTIASTCSEITE